MSERLVIRLGSQANDSISWLVWSDNQQEVIASGQLEHAEQLSTLVQRSSNRPAQVLVPGCDVGLFEVELPQSNRRQALKAIPFMLEDEIAADVEQLHFVYPKPQGKKQQVFVVAKTKIRQWRQWLTTAGIQVNQMTLDWLVLPVPSDENAISVLQLSDHILLRQGELQGQTIATQWLEPCVTLLEQQQENTVQLDNYGVDDAVLAMPYNWHAQDPLLPMQRLAVGFTDVEINLLSSEFAVKDHSKKSVNVWRNVALVASVALVLIFVEKFFRINQLESQQAIVKAQSQEIYKKINPRAKRIDRLKYRIKQQLTQAGGSQTDPQFTAMMVALNQALSQVPQLKPISIKYDNKRQELRVQADGDSYQQFDQFKQALKGQFSVTAGAMNNNGNKVNGSVIIKVAS